MASEIDDFSTSQSEMGKAYSDYFWTSIINESPVHYYMCNHGMIQYYDIEQSEARKSFLHLYHDFHYRPGNKFPCFLLSQESCFHNYIHN